MANKPSDQDPIDFLDYPHTRQQAGEYLRLSMRRLSEYKLAPTPINYAVVYAEASGLDRRLSEELEGIRRDARPLSAEAVRTLFRRFALDCDERLMERYRDDLLNIVAQTLGTLTDFAGTTALAGDTFEEKAARLAGSANIKDVLHIVGELISDSRSLAKQARNMESRVAAYAEEVGRLRAELKRARMEADTDGLTGLLNRRAFWGALESCIQSINRDLPVACLLLLDIDYFKDVNDTHGHIVGDRVLKGLSRTLVKTVKGRDKVARIGGEEFAVLLPDTMLTGARSVAEDIRKRVAAERIPLDAASTEHASITVSAGIAAYHKGESKEDFYHRCDQALYRAKRQGRNRVMVAE